MFRDLAFSYNLDLSDTVDSFRKLRLMLLLLSVRPDLEFHIQVSKYKLKLVLRRKVGRKKLSWKNIPLTLKIY